MAPERPSARSLPTGIQSLLGMAAVDPRFAELKPR